MIDLKRARNDPELFRAALARKGSVEAFDRLMEADRRWLALVPQVDDLRGRMKLKGKPGPDELEKLKQAKADLARLEEELAKADAERDELLAQVPNPPHESAPDGLREEDAVELRRVGEPREITDPKTHLELGRFDMERAARLSGSRFGFMIGDTALLALALYRYALETLAGKGFTPVIPPVLVREEAMIGTGFFPTDKVNIYEIASDGLYLTGTSEVALASLHMTEVLEESELPLRYAGYSTCFRREAGAAGKDTHGMFRVHQFEKVEMFAYTRPEDSWDEHERLVAIEEEILRGVSLPYRVVNVAAGDLGAPAAKKYDIEAWFPSQGRYREVTSCSNTTDFQARRLKVRYRSEQGLEPVHTLNGTAAVGRMVLALLENGQREDGSVEIPEVLVPFGAPARIVLSPRRRQRSCAPSGYLLTASGGVPERSNGTVLKTVGGSRPPWVRIPPPPSALARDKQAGLPSDQGDRNEKRRDDGQHDRAELEPDHRRSRTCYNGQRRQNDKDASESTVDELGDRIGGILERRHKYREHANRDLSSALSKPSHDKNTLVIARNRPESVHDGPRRDDVHDPP